MNGSCDIIQKYLPHRWVWARAEASTALNIAPHSFVCVLAPDCVGQFADTPKLINILFTD